MSILVSGSIAYDHIMNFAGRFKDHIIPDKIHVLNVSFLLAEMNKNVGGTAGNIAYNLSLLGKQPFLFGTVGHDFDNYALHCQLNSINTDFVKSYRDLATASCFITTDLDDNQITGFYPGAMARSAELSIKPIAGKEKISLAVVAPDDPKAMLKHCRELQTLKIPFVLSIGQQVIALDKNDLLTCLQGSKALLGNDYEIEVFCRKTRLDPEKLLGRTTAIITTKGSQGSEIQTSDDAYGIPPVRIAKITDPTGAGDAYCAGILAGLESKLAWPVCGRIASLAASFAVQVQGTQNHTYSLTEFRKKYKKETGVHCPI